MTLNFPGRSASFFPGICLTALARRIIVFATMQEHCIMGKCINHPDRETQYTCMKHRIYLCKECLRCKDPKIYCKYRSSCPIWFLSKRQNGLDNEIDENAEKVETESGNIYSTVMNS